MNRTIFYTIYPKNKLIVKDVTVKPGSTVRLLGHNEKLKWKQTDQDIEIISPALSPSDAPCKHAWTFVLEKIED